MRTLVGDFFNTINTTVLQVLITSNQREAFFN